MTYAMARGVALAASVFVFGCGGSDAATSSSTSSSSSSGSSGTSVGDPPATDPQPTGTDGGTPDAGVVRRALAVDATNPKRRDFTFTAKVADPAATESLGTQGAHLDTRVASVGKLVVFLHGAADQALTSCTNNEVANVLTGKGFHVFLPCYNSYFGVVNCGQNIGECRQEAFEGKDLSPVITIAPSDAIEPRITRALQHLVKQDPGGDWGFFLQDGAPYWPDIVIAGISHGASSAGLIAKIRPVDRAVMLSGPLDTNQAWLTKTSVTPGEKIFGFTHTADPQHAGHLAAFEAMALPGAATKVDGVAAPYGGSHRLFTSATTANAHGSTAPGSASPKQGGNYVFAPVWTTMFGR